MMAVRSPHGLRRDEVEELADVAIGEGDLGVVQVARFLAVRRMSGCARMYWSCGSRKWNQAKNVPPVLAGSPSMRLGHRLRAAGLVMFSSVVAFH